MEEQREGICFRDIPKWGMLKIFFKMLLGIDICLGSFSKFCLLGVISRLIAHSLLQVFTEAVLCESCSVSEASDQGLKIITTNKATQAGSWPEDLVFFFIFTIIGCLLQKLDRSEDTI